jgi:ribosome-associated translation inhibitor RaiA
VHVDLKTNGYPLSNLDQDRLAEAVAHIDRLTDTFPNRRLHVTVERFGHSEDCQVRVYLSTLKHRLVAVDRAPSVAPAIQRCVDILAEQIQLKKDRVHRNHGERTIRRAKEEAGLFDYEKLRLAHLNGDYDAFRDALGEIPDMLEAEIGRRMKFHADGEALVGDAFNFEDIVETIVFHSFGNFMARPENVPFREWILSHVDFAIDELVKDARTERDVDIRPSDMAA